ncbi:unnamed protein product, partial [Leptidea sinapis]
SSPKLAKILLADCTPEQNRCLHEEEYPCDKINIHWLSSVDAENSAPNPIFSHSVDPQVSLSPQFLIPYPQD